MINYQMYSREQPKSFRMAPKEICATNFMRARMGMSINHIADILGRSTASIHLTLKKNHLIGITDNRGKTHDQHIARINAFRDRGNRIACALRIWIDGKASSFKEALSMTIRNFGKVPPQEEYTTGQTNGTKKGTLQDSGDEQEANENSGEGEEEEPA